MSLLYHVNMYLEFLILACTIYILAPRCANYMSEVAQLVEHERKMDHVCDPNSNLSFHAKDVVGGSSPSLTLYGDVVQREHSSSVKKNVMLVA